MEAFFLVFHLIVAVALVSVILLQRSEGGALGMGGGPNGMLSGRGAANLLTKATGWLAAAFIGVALVLAILARQDDGTEDLLRTIEQQEEAVPAPVEDDTPLVPTEEEPATNNP